jgi:hypothetical protein
MASSFLWWMVLAALRAYKKNKSPVPKSPQLIEEPVARLFGLLAALFALNAVGCIEFSHS